MNLVELGPGVYALIDPEPRYGRSNIGLVVDTDGLTVFDTGATPMIGLQAKTMITELTSELDLPIKRVVLSSSRVVHSGGSTPFWAAAFYGSEPTSEQLDAPPNPDAFARLLPEHAEAYGNEFANRPITHTISEPAWLSDACYAIPLRGESASNMILYMEATNVVFAGALASFRVTPLAFDGYPADWVDSIRQLIELNPTVIPGHGLPGGLADLGDLADYLEACGEAEGDASALAAGPWDEWTDRRFDEVNVERAALLAAGRDNVPQSMFSLLGFA